MPARNPVLAIGVGVLLLALGFLLPGATRELILRVVGGLAILAGVAMWVAGRRRISDLRSSGRDGGEPG